MSGIPHPDFGTGGAGTVTILLPFAGAWQGKVA